MFTFDIFFNMHFFRKSGVILHVGGQGNFVNNIYCCPARWFSFVTLSEADRRRNNLLVGRCGILIVLI